MFFRLPIVKFFSRLLNRATITVALVLLQAGWLLWAFSYLTTGRIWVNAALRLLSLFIVLYLVRKDEDSSYKIIWIVLIGLLPLLGGSIGALLGMRVFHHKTKHWYFVWGVPAILLAQLALAVWLLTR